MNDVPLTDINLAEIGHTATVRVSRSTSGRLQFNVS